MTAYVDSSVILRIALRQPSVEMFKITQAILERASQPMPTAIGTLDAIHLGTALIWTESEEVDLVMATHDRALATAAKAHGLLTIGV